MDGSSNSTAPAINIVLTLAGAMVGGALGFFAFGWLVRQGFYAPAIPGVLLGFGGGLLARRRSHLLAVICGMFATALCLFADWRHFPFLRDGSLSYFLTHLADLKPLTLMMIALGGFAGFWFTWRARLVQRSKSIPPPNT